MHFVSQQPEQPPAVPFAPEHGPLPMVVPLLHSGVVAVAKAMVLQKERVRPAKVITVKKRREA